MDILSLIAILKVQYQNKMKLRNFNIDNKDSMVLMGGMNVLESRDLAMQVAEKFKEITQKLNINYIFKGSFDKANRTSLKGKRGAGLKESLPIFDKIKNAINIIIYAENNLDSFLQAEKEILDKIDYLNKFSKPHNFTNQKKINEDIKISYDLEKSDFISSVKKIKQYIMNGDAMQVVLSQRMSMPFYNKPISFYRELRSLNPSPYMYYLNMGDHHIVGSSPEILVRLEDNLITVRPIAGTRPRGKNAVEDDLLAIELKNDSKEIAEHLMLIDLGRNDVGKVSKIGSIKLTDKMIIEKYSHVMHMVSNVTGDILDNLGMMDVLKSTFPAGTVSGAPKFRAIEIIYELESIKRGIYAGAIGYLGWNGNMDTAIAIRTCVIKDGILHIQCGAGIVNDSVPELEWDETINKGKAIVQAYKNLRIKKI